ncbi:MAG TPA: acyl-CoA dehydrogenase family protein [Candidatus Limnocylindria bacterium]|nr:acyl-CoA dehydrogenase family protein [Candidatus Limnocylindria bacterium]
MVNFKPTEEQELLRDTLQNFAREVIRPQAREADENDRIAPELVQKGWELGLVQAAIPEEHGGYGGTRSAVGSAIELEELAYGDLATTMHLVAPRLFTVPLIVAGTPEQRAAWLPRFCNGAFTPATAAFVEPVWNFDPRKPATRAERRGGDYVITGKKCLVPLADRAAAILVYAKTDDGIGAFIVEPGTAGVTVGPREKNLGIHALDTFPVTFESVRVPAAQRLGGEGASVQALIDASRVATAALAVGVSRAAFDYARDYAKERKAFGVAIARKQAIAFMLADMATEVDAMRLLAWEAAWRIDKGLSATREAYLARHYAAQASLKIADNALQVLGGHGYIRDHLVELFLRNARGFAMLDGLAIV